VVIIVVVVIISLIMRAVVLAGELNRADVTATRPYPSDIDPALPELIPPRTGRIVARINRLTGRQQGEIAMPRRAIIGKGS
jgi:hypothetical protein